MNLVSQGGGHWTRDLMNYVVFCLVEIIFTTSQTYHWSEQTLLAWDRAEQRGAQILNVLIMIELIMSNVVICQQFICNMKPTLSPLLSLLIVEGVKS